MVLVSENSESVFRNQLIIEHIYTSSISLIFEVSRSGHSYQARNQDLKIVRQKLKVGLFSPKGGGDWGGGLCPHPQFTDFFEILVLIWCILEAFRCRILKIVNIL